MKKKVNQKQAKVCISKREPFDANSLKGDWYGPSRPAFGRMEYQWEVKLSRLIHDGKEVFIVHSYVTPIAWFADGEWTVPDTKFSVTTSKHQTLVKGAIA